MTDLIEKALEEWQDENERTAYGVIDGHEVRLRKEKYKPGQLKPEMWRVAVYVEGEDYASKRNQNLEASTAQKEFEKFVDKYNLSNE
jgi:Ni/Co efflux regulator RcnB